MNDYRITAYTANREEMESIITERTERAARDSFKKAHEGQTYDIFNVELIRENTCATKQQERDTLEAIKKMVEELGPQSYLATAFEGCFEDAEANIDNDFGDSWKRRCESADKKLDEVEAAAQEKIAALETELRKAKQGIEELIQKDDERKAAIERLEQKTLTDDELTGLKRLVVDKRLSLEDEVKNAAGRIVEAAEEPGSASFQNAVKDHRAAKADLEHCTALLKKLAEVSEQ